MNSATSQQGSGIMVKAADVALTGAQLRAARALIGMSAEELAQVSKVSLRTIRRAEGDDGPVKLTAANVAAIIQIFRKAGISFTSEAGKYGVELQTK